MDQILPIVESLLGRIDWISAGLSGLCGGIVALFAGVFARGFELEGWRHKLVCVVIFAVSIWPVRTGAKTYIAPPLYEWAHEERIVQELGKLPLYALLFEHHPETKTQLVRAAVKAWIGGKAANVGFVEFNTIVMHHVAAHFSRTTDHAAMQFVFAATAVVDQMLILRPTACIALLEGDRHAFDGLPEHVLRRYQDALAVVIREAIADPQPVPDADRIERLQHRVIERLERDGNPLATDMELVMSDPQRACFALLAVFHSIVNSIQQEEIGAFLRGTVPAFLADDEI